MQGDEKDDHLISLSSRELLPVPDEFNLGAGSGNDGRTSGFLILGGLETDLGGSFRMVNVDKKKGRGGKVE